MTSRMWALALAPLILFGGCDNDGNADAGPRDGGSLDGGAPDAGPTPTRSWSVVQEGLPGALLSVTFFGDMGYAVGADDAMGPMVLRRDGGDTWARVLTGATGDLWWIAADGTDALLVGEAGLMLAHTPGTDVFDPLPVITDKTLFGVWAADDGTAWSVGGDIRGDVDRGVLLVRRGGTWQVDDTAPVELYSDVLLFKVWGTSSSDVWVVGERGRMLHYDGSAWARIESGTTARLLTIHGSATDGPIAVGGLSNGVILEWDGAAFTDHAPEFIPPYNGVRVLSDGQAFAVGNNGLLSTRAGGEWTVEEAPPTNLDLHAVTVEADGTAWAVGGAISSPALDRGVLLRFSETP